MTTETTRSDRFAVLRRAAVAAAFAAVLAAHVAHPLPALAGGCGACDDDGDGLTNAEEYDLYGTDLALYDTDGDGVGDGDEVYYGTDPLSYDGDGGYGGDSSDSGAGDLSGDRDGDGLIDEDELFVYGTDVDAYDTDGDGLGDGEEVYNGTRPGHLRRRRALAGRRLRRPLLPAAGPVGPEPHPIAAAPAGAGAVRVVTKPPHPRRTIVAPAPYPDDRAGKPAEDPGRTATDAASCEPRRSAPTLTNHPALRILHPSLSPSNGVPRLRPGAPHFPAPGAAGRVCVARLTARVWSRSPALRLGRARMGARREHRRPERAVSTDATRPAAARSQPDNFDFAVSPPSPSSPADGSGFGRGRSRFLAGTRRARAASPCAAGGDRRPSRPRAGPTREGRPMERRNPLAGRAKRFVVRYVPDGGGDPVELGRERYEVRASRVFRKQADRLRGEGKAGVVELVDEDAGRGVGEATVDTERL